MWIVVSAAVFFGIVLALFSFGFYVIFKLLGFISFFCLIGCVGCLVAYFIARTIDSDHTTILGVLCVLFLILGAMILLAYIVTTLNNGGSLDLIEFFFPDF